MEFRNLRPTKHPRGPSPHSGEIFNSTRLECHPRDPSLAQVRVLCQPGAIGIGQGTGIDGDGRPRREDARRARRRARDLRYMARETSRFPHLVVEGDLFAEGFRIIGAVDEVGRGSLFGPCCVGLVVIDSYVGAFPAGLRDSKLLTPTARDGLVEPLRLWVRGHAVGEASAEEIDDFGLTAALRLAGLRALVQLNSRPEVIVLDGSHDWLGAGPATLTGPAYPEVRLPTVRTRVKADVTCASVAAASVLAKVHRDRLICEMAHEIPGYDLEHNKGYATAAHLAALRELGPSAHHRVSWKLPARVR